MAASLDQAPQGLTPMQALERVDQSLRFLAGRDNHAMAAEIQILRDRLANGLQEGGVSPVIQEAVEAAFAERHGWRTRIAAATREIGALTRYGTAPRQDLKSSPAPSGREEFEPGGACGCCGRVDRCDPDCDAVSGERRRGFDEGVMWSAAVVQRQHDQPVIAADLIREADLIAYDCSELAEFDRQELAVVNRESGMKLKGLE